MRKLVTIFLVVLAASAMAQQKPAQFISGLNVRGVARDQFQVDSLLYMPLYDTTKSPGRSGVLVGRSGNDKLYWYDGLQWRLMINSSDTAAMLGGYLRKADTTGKWIAIGRRFVDTVFAVNDTVLSVRTKDGVGNVVTTLVPVKGRGGGGGSTPTLQQVLTAGNQITTSPQLIKGQGATVLQFDSLTNINWRHKGFFRIQADGGQANSTFSQSTISLTAGDSIVINTPSTRFTVLPPAYLYNNVFPYTRAGTAGTDSVVVKKSDGSLGTISATYYGTGSGGGNTNSNIGSGYRLAIPNTNNIKTVFPGFAMLLDSTSNTNGLTFKFDSTTGSGFHTQGYNDLRYLQPSCQWPSERPFGSIYNKNYWVSTYDFGAAGEATAALSGNGISITAGTARNFTDYLAVNTPLNSYTMIEKWTMSVKFVISSALGSTTNGVALGLHAIGTRAYDICGRVSLTSGSDGFVYINRPSANVQLAASGSQISYSQNDTIQLTVDWILDSMTVTARNVTTGGSAVVLGYNLGNPAAAGGILPNTGQFTVYPVGTGVYKITSLSISSTETRNPLVMCFGDSKTQGFFASTFAQRWPSLLNASFPTTIVHAGEGDNMTAGIGSINEALAFNPYQVLILGYGRNSLADGYTVSQVGAWYDTLFNWFNATGAKVWVGQFPEGSGSGQQANVASLNAYLKAKYPSNYIPVYDTLITNTGAYLYSDSIHLSQGGETKVAAVVAPYLIQCNNRTFQVQKGYDPLIAGDSVFHPIPYIINSFKLNDSTTQYLYSDGAVKDVTLRFGTSSTTWENVLDNGATLTHDHTVAGGANQFIWSNTLMELASNSFFIPTTNGGAQIGFHTNRFSHVWTQQTLSGLNVFGNVDNWDAQHGYPADATTPLTFVPVDTDTTKSIINLYSPDALTLKTFSVKADGRLAIKADSVGAATGGWVFKDAATGLLKIGPGAPGGNDTLKAVNAGTNGENQVWSVADTLKVKRAYGPLSVSVTTSSPDSGLIYKLVNDTSFSTSLTDYIYGWNYQRGTGALGYSNKLSLSGDLRLVQSSGLFQATGTTYSSGGYDRVVRNISTGRYEIQQGSPSYFTPVTGGTVSLSNNAFNIINPAGALATLTVNMPSSPADGDFVEIKFTQAVTTVTFANGTVADGITAPTAGGYYKYVYRATGSTWY